MKFSISRHFNDYMSGQNVELSGKRNRVILNPAQLEGTFIQTECSLSKRTKGILSNEFPAGPHELGASL